MKTQGRRPIVASGSGAQTVSAGQLSRCGSSGSTHTRLAVFHDHIGTVVAVAFGVHAPSGDGAGPTPFAKKHMVGMSTHAPGDRETEPHLLPPHVLEPKTSTMKLLGHVTLVVSHVQPHAAGGASGSVKASSTPAE